MMVKLSMVASLTAADDMYMHPPLMLEAVGQLEGEQRTAARAMQ
jgi:hypothetical protein